MIDLTLLKKLNPQSRRINSLLGLALDGSRLDGVVLRRTNGSLQLQQTFSVTLSLDPLIADPELVGREIRNHLDTAGVRERFCVVSVPLKWALTAHTELPDLAEADIPGFLQIEAERGFHSDIESLNYATSRYAAPGGPQRVTLAGIPRSHISLLEDALRVAKLKPVSFALGISALQPAGEPVADGVLALAIGENHVGLQISCGGGIAALRALEGTVEAEGSRRVLHTEVIGREVRITLGQLPADLRSRVKRIRIFGPRDLAQQLADEMELRLEPMGLKVEVVKEYARDEFGVELPSESAVSPAFSLAAWYLARRATPLEFLPPRVSAFRQFTTKYASGKYRMALIAGGAVLVIGLAFLLFQQWQIIRLQSQWNTMAQRVGDLEVLQDKIQQYRPWYDDSLRGLEILKQLTAAFPDDGAVSAKTLEITDLNKVTCTGVAKDNQSFLLMLARLRASQQVAEVKVVQIRGRSPMQFSFDFRWSEGGGHSAN